MLRIILVLLLATGCGYQFQGSGSVLPDDVKSVAIMPVENRTQELGIGPKFTEALRDRFERHGVVKVVDDPRDADAVLRSTIKRVDVRVRNVRGVTDVEVASDLIVSIAAELKRRTGQILWRDDDVRVIQPFASVSDIVVTESSSFVGGEVGTQQLQNLTTREVSRGQQETAMQDLLEEAARQIYTDAVAADF